MVRDAGDLRIVRSERCGAQMLDGQGVRRRRLQDTGYHYAIARTDDFRDPGWSFFHQIPVHV